MTLESTKIGARSIILDDGWNKNSDFMEFSPQEEWESRAFPFDTEKDVELAKEVGEIIRSLVESTGKEAMAQLFKNNLSDSPKKILVLSAPKEILELAREQALGRGIE